jgi:hypothetical protein
MFVRADENYAMWQTCSLQMRTACAKCHRWRKLSHVCCSGHLVTLKAGRVPESAAVDRLQANFALKDLREPRIPMPPTGADAAQEEGELEEGEAMVRSCQT